MTERKNILIKKFISKKGQVVLDNKRIGLDIKLLKLEAFLINLYCVSS